MSITQTSLQITNIQGTFYGEVNGKKVLISGVPSFFFQFLSMQNAHNLLAKSRYTFDDLKGTLTVITPVGGEAEFQSIPEIANMNLGTA